MKLLRYYLFYSLFLFHNLLLNQKDDNLHVKPRTSNCVIRATADEALTKEQILEDSSPFRYFGKINEVEFEEDGKTFYVEYATRQDAETVIKTFEKKKDNLGFSLLLFFLLQIEFYKYVVIWKNLKNCILGGLFGEIKEGVYKFYFTLFYFILFCLFYYLFSLLRKIRYFLQNLSKKFIFFRKWGRKRIKECY
jgi:hypothetical protein